MSEFKEIVKDAMIGVDTHINVFKGLENLTHTQACERVIGQSHSTYEIVYHMIVWQEILIKNVKNEEVDWKAAMKTDWPTAEYMATNRWEELIVRFRKGFAEMEGLLVSEDLSRPLPTLQDAPLLKAFLVLNQHNSYHLGQISKNRVAQGTWF